MRAKEVPFKRHPIGGRAGPEEPRSLYVRTLRSFHTLQKTTIVKYGNHPWRISRSIGAF